jgi:hypothetical protein
MLSAKFLDDIFYNNAFYAKLGGVTPLEMNTLEIEFLKLINFSLFVTFDSYNQYKNELFRFTESSPKSISNSLPLYIPIYFGNTPATIPSTKSPVSITGVSTVVGCSEMEGYSAFQFPNNEVKPNASDIYQQQLSKNILDMSLSGFNSQNVLNQNGNFSSNRLIGGLVLSQPNYSQSLTSNPWDNQDNYTCNTSINQQHSIEQRNNYSNHIQKVKGYQQIKETFCPYTHYGMKMEVDPRNCLHVANKGVCDQNHSSLGRSHPLFYSSL